MHKIGGKSFQLAGFTSENCALLEELGVKASSVLQPNGVIWVEGLSDKIYIKRWMQLYAEEAQTEPLTEGVHYVFLEYGGKCLSHFCFSPESLDEVMIQAFRLNPNHIIVMDRDGANETDPINQTKRRIQNECNFSWITKGREIENYLPPEIVGFDLDPFDSIDAKKRDFRKVPFAKESALKINLTNWKTLDLFSQISAIVQEVTTWNNL